MFTKKTNLMVCVLLLVSGPASLVFGNETPTLLRSVWGGNDYVDLRLVSGHSHVPGDGKLTLALEIKLKPGWVTYWTMPGESGFPPKITRKTFQNVARFDVKWPAPSRHELPYSDAIGYGGHVLIPIDVVAEAPQRDVSINLDWRIAVCEEFCVLHEETFKLTIPAASTEQGPANTMDAAAIERAAALVPSRGSADASLGEAFRVHSVTVEHVGKMATLDIALDRKEPSPDVPELYISSKEGIRFGTPTWQIVSGGQQIRYRFPVFLPDAVTTLAGCDLTVVLVSPEGAFQTKASVRASP